MSGISRSEFLGLGATLAAGLSAGCAPGRGQETESLSDLNTADLVLVNGNVRTQDEALPTAEAFAVKRGRFVAVGRSDDISNLIAPGRTTVLDAEGRTVLPGFIDAHSHPSYVGLNELKNVNTNLGSIARIQQALRERASLTPPGDWVVGFMYDDTKQQEGRPLNRWDLDEAVPDHPVMVNHRGGHTSVVNSMAARGRTPPGQRSSPGGRPGKSARRAWP